MAHGERMEMGEDAAAEKAEDEEKDTTILLSDEEIEQFVTVTKKKRKKPEEEKRKKPEEKNQFISCPGGRECEHCIAVSAVWNCKTCRDTLSVQKRKQIKPPPCVFWGSDHHYH